MLIIILIITTVVLCAAVGAFGEYLIRIGRENDLVKGNYDFYNDEEEEKNEEECK